MHPYEAPFPALAPPFPGRPFPFAGSAPAVLPSRPGRVRRYRRPVALGLAVVLVVAGATIAVAGLWRTPGPAEVVGQYFAALRSGDADRALSYGPAPTGDTRLLTDRVLRVQNGIAALSPPAVLAVHQSGDRAEVRVRYGAGQSEPVTETLGLHRRSRRWTMDSTAHAVTLDITTARNRFTVAGFSLPSRPVLLFPGTVPLTSDSAAVGPTPDEPLVSLHPDGPLSLQPALTDEGRSRITAALTTALQGCLDLGGRAPATCPLQSTEPTAVPGSVRGRLTRDVRSPTLTLTSDDAGGRVDIRGDAEITGTWQTLDFENQLVAHTGTVTVSLQAVCALGGGRTPVLPLQWVTS